MIWIDLLRSIFVIGILFANSIWWIYLFVFLLGMLGSAFNPTSTTYIAKFIPTDQRKKFNALFSFTTSGAFLLGPSISGVLITLTSVDLCILLNAISFFISAIVIYYLPNVDQDKQEQKSSTSYLQTLKHDWQTIFRFGKTATYFILVFLLFQFTMLIGFALDSQEATFITDALQLSTNQYGILVSVVGIGYFMGSFAVTMFIQRISLPTAIGFGMILTSFGYLLFYLSHTFIYAAIGFWVLGFFSSFANTGYMTFYQHHVPTDLMGRFTSATYLVQGILQILLTLIVGFLADQYSLQFVMVSFSIVALVGSIALCIVNFLPSKKGYYGTPIDT